MKLKDAARRISDWTGTDAERAVMREIKSEVRLTPAPLRYFDFMKDGKKLRHLYCPTCGMEWEMEQSKVINHPCTDKAYSGNNYRSYTGCYGYGIESVFHDENIPEADKREKAVIYEIADGLIIFGLLKNQYRFVPQADRDECLKRGDYEFLRGEWVPEPSERFIFLSGYGFRATTDSKISSPASQATADMVKDLKKCVLVSRKSGELDEYLKANGIPVTADGALAALIAQHEQIEAKRKERGARTDKTEQALKDYEPGEVSSDTLFIPDDRVLTSKISEIGNEVTAWVHCTACGTTKKRTYNRHDNNRCPECGTALLAPYRSDNETTRTRSVFDVSDDGTLVERIFKATTRLDKDGVVKHSAREIQRLFFTPKKLVLMSADINGEWKKTRLGELARAPEAVQSKDEIREAVEKSTVKYAGLVKAWGLDGSDAINNPGGTEYFARYLKEPYLETLLAAGMRHLVVELMRRKNRMVADPGGKTPCEILGITKAAFKIARKYNLSLSDIAEAGALCEADSSFNETDWEAVRGVPKHALLNVIELYGVPYRKAMEYLDGCYGYQCIERGEALTLWRDYLKMATDMEYDLTDKSRKYPRSLKKEHDKATFAYRAVRAEKKTKLFAARAKENARLNYENAEFIGYAPKTPEEMVNEGIKQHHCIASYIDAVTDGTAQMLFIRKKDDPDTPYYACEIRGRRIVQVRGYCNKTPSEKKVLAFIGALAAKNGLAYR